MSGPNTELNRVCRKLGDVTEVLPSFLSETARKEINNACGRLAEKAKQKAEDLEHLTRGDLEKISKDTWKEIAELAKDLGQSSTPTPPPRGYTPLQPGPMINLEDLTKGKGDRLKLSVPVKFVSRHTDVYLIVNYDRQALMGDFDLKLYGAGAGLGHKFGDNTKLTGEITVDTSSHTTQPAGFIKLEIKF